MYLDDDGNEQGPFPFEDMEQWFAEYFTESTQVREVGSKAPFTEIGKCVPRPSFAGPAPTPAVSFAPAIAAAPTKHEAALAAKAKVEAAVAVQLGAGTTPDSSTPAAKAAKSKTTWFYVDSKGNPFPDNSRF